MINKKNIAEDLSDVFDINITQSENIIKYIFSFIKTGIKSDGKISIGNFGIFRKKYRKGRNCRNPKTGEKLFVNGMNIVKFTPARSFKDLIK